MFRVRKADRIFQFVTVPVLLGTAAGTAIALAYLIRWLFL